MPSYQEKETVLQQFRPLQYSSPVSEPNKPEY